MALQDDLKLLYLQPALRVFHDEAMRFLAFSSEEVTAQTGEVLFRKGDKASGAYLIRQGQLSLVTTDTTETQELFSGDLVDESALLAEVRYRATGIARAPTTLIFIPRSAVQRVLQEYPDLIGLWEDDIVRRLQDVKTTLEKVMKILPPPQTVNTPEENV
jgi:CRP-like cAMP-binding protein